MKKADRIKRAEAFEKSASSLQKQIDAKRDPAIAHQNLTARRARIATSMANDADYLEQFQKVYQGMAEDLRNNCLPRILYGITTRAMIERIMAVRYRRPGVHYSTVKDALKATKKVSSVRAERLHIKRLKPDDYWLNLPTLKNIDCMVTLLKVASEKDGNYFMNQCITSLNTDKRMIQAGIRNPDHWQVAHDTMLGYCKSIPDRKAERELRDLEYSLIGAKIPGFFPTPASIVKLMLGYADIYPGMRVLEPSAGKGDIAEGIVSDCPDANLKVIELNHTLSKILQAKGFDTEHGDFLEHKGSYQRIVMNPPFEKFQDIDHVKHAYSLLEDGGILVSIVCEACFSRQDKKALNFRHWLEERGSDFERLDSGSFQGSEAFRQTGVASRIIVLEK